MFISLCIFVKTCCEAKSWWLTRQDWKTTKQHTHSRPVKERFLRVHSLSECMISSYNGLYLHTKWSHGKQCYILLDFIFCCCCYSPELFSSDLILESSFASNMERLQTPRNVPGLQHLIGTIETHHCLQEELVEPQPLQAIFSHYWVAQPLLAVSHSRKTICMYGSVSLENLS